MGCFLLHNSCNFGYNGGDGSSLKGKVQPSYYSMNGLSPIDAMKQGLISDVEYRGFLIGNVLKYITRFQYKENPLEDLKKCKDYLEELIAMFDE